jgi:hypothetical protein
MKCPWCGNEMEDGFIGITGELFDVSWYRDPTVLGLKGGACSRRITPGADASTAGSSYCNTE